MKTMDGPGEAMTAAGIPRCAFAASAAQCERGGAFLLEASRSLIHDTRNRLTGLSLYLDALCRELEGARSVSKKDLGILERSLRGIECLCGEFTCVETAMKAVEMPADAGEMSAWYACYLSGLGISAFASPGEDPVELTRARWGILSRALIELSRLLVKVNAREVQVGATCADGVFNFEVAFVAPLDCGQLKMHPLMRPIAPLLENCGGEVEVASSGYATSISMRFAQLHAALGD